MPSGLKRYYGMGDLHFVTFSCYRKLPFLGTRRAREVFVRELARVRAEYGFRLIGYVVMPNHVHLLMSEPAWSSWGHYAKGEKGFVEIDGWEN